MRPLVKCHQVLLCFIPSIFLSCIYSTPFLMASIYKELSPLWHYLFNIVSENVYLIERLERIHYNGILLVLGPLHLRCNRLRVIQFWIHILCVGQCTDTSLNGSYWSKLGRIVRVGVLKIYLVVFVFSINNTQTLRIL